MEAAYGIGVQNRYALFLDEDEEADPFTALAKSAPVAGAAVLDNSKKSLPAAANKSLGKPSQQGKPLSESKSNTTPKDIGAGRQNQRSNKATGGGVGGQQQQQQQGRSYGSGGNRENQENHRSADNSNRSPRGNKAYDNTGDDLAARDGKEVRRNGFGRAPRTGGPRGQFAGAGGAKFDNQRSGKRDFNRHSGSDKTGVKAQDKREGSGSYNWGKAIDDADVHSTEVVNGEAGAEEAGAEKQHPDAGKADNEGEGAGVEDAPKEDEEPATKTLDEYKREIEEKRMHTQFNIRKAGEGEDKSKWKKTYVLKKKAEFSEDEVEYEEIEVEEDANKRRNRKVLDIQISFRPSDEGRDFGARRPPGGGGRGPRDRADRGPGAPGAPGAGEHRGGEHRGGEHRGAEHRGGEHRGDRPPRDRPPREAGRPSRGGGAPRGAGGRGGRFQSAPKFDDLNDFPSL